MIGVLAFVGGFLTVNVAMMFIWTVVFNGEDWFDMEDFILLSLARWFKLACIASIIATCVWIFSPKDDNHETPSCEPTTVEEPLQY